MLNKKTGHSVKECPVFGFTGLLPMAIFFTA